MCPALLEAILQHLPPVDADAPEAADPANEGIRVAIVGRPNVGKSTLVNRLLGEDRVVVSDVAGTTRDSIRVLLERDGKRYTLIDTAGVRRRARVEEAVEKFSVIKTLQSIAAANVAVLLLDAQEGVSEQDATLIGHVLDAGRALVIAVNKWDGLTTYEREQCKSSLSRKLDFVTFSKPIFISALHGSGIAELMRSDRPRTCVGDASIRVGGADPRAGKGLRKLSAAAGARTRAETALCPSGRQQSADDRDSRQPHQAYRRRLPALSGKLLPQALQARRHADPHRIQGRRKSLCRTPQRADRKPGQEAPAPGQARAQALSRYHPAMAVADSFDATQITAAILAGGAGSRVGGRDKGLILLGKKLLVEHVGAALEGQVGES